MSLLVPAYHIVLPRSLGGTLRPRRAFTLIEVLVSMTVAILLVVLLLKIFSTSTTSWQRGETRTDAYREARAALQIMSRDLSQTVRPLPTPGPVSSSAAAPTPTPATTAAMPVLVLQRSPEAVPEGNYAFESVYCLTAIPGNGGSSDVSAVGYYCKWDPNKHAFVLMRQFANSDATFTNIYHGDVSHNPPLLFLDLFSQNAKTVPVPATATDLASYIWHLEFRIDSSLKMPVTEPPAVPVAPPKSNALQPPGLYFGRDPDYPNYPLTLPPFVEIRFKAMSTSAARTLENNSLITQAVWEDSTNALYQKFILPSAQQFSARIPFANFDATAASATPTPSP